MKIRAFLQASPLYEAYRLHNEVVLDFQRRLKPEGLHLVQALILVAAFFEERSLRPTEIASALEISRSNASHAISGLERRGWLRRETSALDARAYLLSLTPAGRRKATRLIGLFDGVQSRFESRLGAARVAVLNRGLRKLVQAYGTGDGPGARR